MKLWIDTDFSMTVVRVILIFRVLRFFRWVVSFEKYHLIYDTFVKLVPLFLDLLGVLTIAFYVYSTLGTVLFGGYIKTNLDINFSQYGDPPYYVYVNFNDFAQGLYTCVHLLIVNNWLYTVKILIIQKRFNNIRWMSIVEHLDILVTESSLSVSTLLSSSFALTS